METLNTHKIEIIFVFQCSAQSVFHQDSLCHRSKTVLLLLSQYSNTENATTTTTILAPASLNFLSKQIRLTEGTASYLVKGAMLLLPPLPHVPITHTHTLLQALALTWLQRWCLKVLTRWKLFFFMVIFQPDHFLNPAHHTTAGDSMEEVEEAQCPENTPLQEV